MHELRLEDLMDATLLAAPALMNFLEYVYVGELVVQESTAVPLLQLADFFDDKVSPKPFCLFGCSFVLCAVERKRGGEGGTTNHHHNNNNNNNNKNTNKKEQQKEQQQQH